MYNINSMWWKVFEDSMYYFVCFSILKNIKIYIYNIVIRVFCLDL